MSCIRYLPMAADSLLPDVVAVSMLVSLRSLYAGGWIFSLSKQSAEFWDSVFFLYGGYGREYPRYFLLTSFFYSSDKYYICTLFGIIHATLVISLSALGISRGVDIE